MGRKFQDSTGADLPVGSHEPCQLLSITRHEPSEEKLKKWPDMKPSLCFRFMLYRPDDPELHGATGVRFRARTRSASSANCSSSCTDLRDGDQPDEFDEADYVGEWYRVDGPEETGSGQALRHDRLADRRAGRRPGRLERERGDREGSEEGRRNG